MKINKGDLVACYVMGSSMEESLMQHGIVLDTHPDLEDVLVLDNYGMCRWWPAKRWRLLSGKKVLDTDT